MDHPLSARPTASTPARHGLAWGFVGVLAFSFTVPFTRVAVGGLAPLVVGAGRAVVAGALAAVALTLTRQALPRGAQWARLAVVASGVVIGFPFLTSFALQSVPASHGAVVVGLLPAATAVAAVLRAGERPARSFWVFAVVGAVAAIGFAAVQGGGLGGLHRADLLLLGAVAAAAVGYAEGGVLARELGSWQTISWALVVVAPVTVALAAAAVVREPPHASASQWAAFAYLAVVSMYLGFFAWYRGLALGPMARVSQVQLVQPVLTILWAWLLLHEHVTWPTVLGGLAVVASAGLAVRTRLARATT
ncbi:DMT family transporter [Luteimicrobium sp. NPDC057192]|uniref:DMT family transporter n=1 Tax=Luteimicrobium sp. NPDC057192 TaxID=3346042 RepID=UPI0036319E12